jgi:CHASE3 domain sensor protein
MNAAAMTLPKSELVFANLSIRAKIAIGFVLVLGLSSVSMSGAYLGYERILDGFGQYRLSLSEAEYAHEIDASLAEYQNQVRCFALTGSDEAANAAEDARRRLERMITVAKTEASTLNWQQAIKDLFESYRTYTDSYNKVLVLKAQNARLADASIRQAGADIVARLGHASARMASGGALADVRARFDDAHVLTGAAMNHANADVVTLAGRHLRNVTKLISAMPSDAVAGLDDLRGRIEAYRQALETLGENNRKVADLMDGMWKLRRSLGGAAASLKRVAMAEHADTERRTSGEIAGGQNFVLVLAFASIAIGLILSWAIGGGIADP